MAVSTSITISAILAIIVGIIILIWPKFLNIAVGLYLLIAGFLSIFSF
ncbi:DUF3096 domain-containing protein [Candidatus Pacearchaeota archaeon]|nr:DUF3096 domain-containing protein [Candidatus Pacearchaeota archaeon]